MDDSLDAGATASTPLKTCGCREGDGQALEPRLHNRPGLPALAYRIATHATFLQRMLALLPRQTASGDATDGPLHPLAALTTRASDDPAIALLDAWATAGDVLTFYQERIANEGYLRTAMERRSILELARTIGYELSPGVAASAYLVFSVEDAPGAPGRATVPTGTRIQSIPGQNEKPRTFETIEAIEARGEWNALEPRQTEPQQIVSGQQHLYLKGVDTQLQPGDAILIVGDERIQFPGSERWDFRVLRTVELNPKAGYTLVTWELGLGHHTNPPTPPASKNARLFAFRQRAALFGYNAPDWRAMPDAIKVAYDPDYKPEAKDGRRTQWPDFELQPGEGNTIDLDAVYPKILDGSWVVLVRQGYQELYRVMEASPASRTDFTLTAKTTRLSLDAREHLNWFGLRNTVVYAQSEELALAEEPIPDAAQGDTIELEQDARGLEAGRTLLVSGKRMRARVAQGGLSLTSADGSRSVQLTRGDSLLVMAPPETEARTGSVRWQLRDRNGFAGVTLAGAGELVLEPAAGDDEVVSEVAFIESVSALPEGPARLRATLKLSGRLKNCYDRATVTIYANVALATHGESVREVLGSGDGSRANQRFTLKRSPLTFVSAPTASGTRSTLAVQVNRVLWAEAPSLHGLAPRGERYVVRIEDDGKATVVFGDGECGARLPSGQENVAATYRFGIGPEGEVRAGSLALLQTRPLGIRGVTNPLPASGAAGPEDRDAARANAPITVLTLDRIVSLQDFEDFARAFAGIGKAKAVALWQGERQLVHLTVAATNGGPVEPDSALAANLQAAVDAVRDPVREVRVDSYEPRLFRLAAKVLVDPRYLVSDVLSSVGVALRATFTFERRSFSQAVSAAEIVMAIQQVAGVVAVDLDQLYLVGEDGGTGAALASYLAAATAHFEDGEIRPAQLLLLDPGPIGLIEMRLNP